MINYYSHGQKGCNVFNFIEIKDREAIVLFKSLKESGCSGKQALDDMELIDRLLITERLAPLMRRKGRKSRSYSDHLKQMERVLENHWFSEINRQLPNANR